MTEDISVGESEFHHENNLPLSNLEENSAWRYRSGYMNPRAGIRNIIHSSLQEILSAYIDPLMKQWVRNFHVSLLIILGLIKKFRSPQVIPVPRNVSGLDLPEKERESLCRGEETGLLEGFTSKTGKKFNAYLKLDPRGKVQFRFPNQKASKIGQENALGKIDENYPKIPDPIPKSLLGVELNEEVRECLKKGIESPLVMGLKSKKGNVFNAYLRMNLNGELKFRFENEPQKGPLNQSIKIPIKESSQEKISEDSSLRRDNEAQPKILPEELSSGTHPTTNFQSKPFDEKNPMPQDIPSPETHGELGNKWGNMEKISPSDPKVNGLAFPLDGTKKIDPEPDKIQTNSSNLTNEAMSKSNSLSSNSAIRSNLNSKLSKPSQKIPESILGQILNRESLLALESGKETELIKDLHSPSGKIFDAYLQFIKPDRIQLRIPSREKDLKITTIPKIILGVSLSDQHKNLLRIGQETPLLPNFHFQNGKPFEAYLRRDEKGSLIIRTPPVRREISIHSI